MSSTVQILRRITGAAGSPGATGRQEGELFANMAPAPTAAPELWVFGGAKGWLRINPPASISVVSKNIPGTTSPSGDGNAQVAGGTGAAVWPWVVNAGEVPIVNHNGTAYAFTGGPGSWGTTAGGTALTAGMFTALGAAPGDPQVLDWSTRTEADLGAAYTAASPTLGTGLVAVKWRDGQTYILTNPAAPNNAASYLPVATSKPTQPVKVLDWSALAGNPTTITAAYTAWNGLDTTNNVLNPADVTLVKYGSPADTYVVVDTTAPTTTASYFLLHHPADALAFTASYDVTQPYVSGTMQPKHTGDFGLVASTASPGGTPIDGSWAAVIEGVTAGSTLNQGDMLIWDGSKFVALATETDLSGYVPFSGTPAGTPMTNTAVITFDVPAGAAPATPTVRLDGGDPGKSSIDNFTIDCGVIP